jgi:transposase
MKTTTKKVTFKGEELYIGIDVHLRSWMITILSKNLFIKRFSQEADDSRLISFLQAHYPEAKIKCVYEAGYCGFWLAFLHKRSPSGLKRDSQKHTKF